MECKIYLLSKLRLMVSLELEFSVKGDDNKAGIRLDDIRISEKK